MDGVGSCIDPALGVLDIAVCFYSAIDFKPVRYPVPDAAMDDAALLHRLVCDSVEDPVRVLHSHISGEQLRWPVLLVPHLVSVPSFENLYLLEVLSSWHKVE